MWVKKDKISILVGLTLGALSFNAIATNDKIPLKGISKIAEVFSIIDEKYVDDVNKSDLMINALSGMVDSLDPYSHYLSKDESEDFKKNVSGENVGLGVIIAKDESGLKIETVLKESAAEKAGLESGDVIIKVEDKYIIDSYNNPLDAVRDITGEVGTFVNVTVQKGNNKEVKEFKIKRDYFTSPSTTVKLIDDDYGYIYISSFQTETEKELQEAFTEFKKENPDPKGFIIDLRSNPGGLLNAAVKISDMFLNKGVIVSTKGRFEDSHETLSTKGDITNGKPIVVLINGGTASAAEILAGAIQDNKRGIVVGQTSYGKGSVQTLIPLSGNDGDMLKLTIARYYTPSGRSIQAEGIVPDINIKRVSNVDLIETKRTREKDNENHISNDTDYKADSEGSVDELDINKDYQLYEAVNILKAITIL